MISNYYDIDDNLKSYLDAKFDAIDAKFENLQETMLACFQKQKQGMFKHFRDPN